METRSGAVISFVCARIGGCEELTKEILRQFESYGFLNAVKSRRLREFCVEQNLQGKQKPRDWPRRKKHSKAERLAKAEEALLRLKAQEAEVPSPPRSVEVLQQMVEQVLIERDV